MVGVDQHPVAVPLAFESPLRLGVSRNGALGRQHGGQIGERRLLLLLHPVSEPVLAVGLDERVAPPDLLAVQRHDHLAAFGGAVGRVVGELLGVIGSGVPDIDLTTAVLPFRDLSSERQVFHRVILGVHREVIDRRGVGQVLGYRPTDQNAITFQPEVVVQPARVMLLDDERVVVADLRRLRRNRFGRLRTVPHAAIGGQPIGHRQRLVELAEQIPVALPTLQDLGERQMAQIGVLDLLPGPRGRDGRMFASAKRIRCDRGLVPVVLAPVQEDLSLAQTLGHRRGDLLRHHLLELHRHPFGQHRRAARADRVIERNVEVQSLAAAGQRERSQPDVGDEISDLVRDLAELTHAHALTGIEIEHDPGGLPHLLRPAPLAGNETPLRHMDFQ